MTSKIEIIISRFNEDLKWTTRGIFNNYRYIVYNKGDNDDFEKTNVDKIINLKNVGKCDHTYLYHIIKNYNDLADILVFLSGSLDLINKNIRATEILDIIKNKFENFCLNNWRSTNNQNFDKNNESMLDLSLIRPFGEWYKYNFDNIIVNFVCYWGIFSLDKRDIIQHPINRYINLINQLNSSSNPEVGHYIERSWAAIFHPMNYTKLIIKNY